MSININHTNNTFCSNSGVFIFGTGIVPIIEDAVYSNNFSGKYYGDGSSLIGLPSANQFIPLEVENYEACGIPYSKGSGSYFTTGSTIGKSNFSSILQGSQGIICCSDYSIILNGSVNCSWASEYNLIFGKNNEIYTSPNSVSIGSSNVNSFGKDNYIIGLSNTISAGCSIYIVGSGINLGYNGSGNTLYVNNLCAYDGIIYGDGAGITGLLTGNFVTTGETGAFAPVSFLDISGTMNIAGYGKSVVGGCFGSCPGITSVFINNGYSVADPTTSNNFMVGSYMFTISGGARGNTILNSNYGSIKETVCNSTILGGESICATESCTTYSHNFCAHGGKYYGDGSSLTGLGSQTFTGNGSCYQLTSGSISKNIIIIAEKNGLTTSGYLCSNQSPNLYAAGNQGNMISVSATVVGWSQTEPNKSMSMKIEATIVNREVLSQVKNYYVREVASNDASIVVENNYLKLVVSGLDSNLRLTSKLDILSLDRLDV